MSKHRLEVLAAYEAANTRLAKAENDVKIANGVVKYAEGIQRDAQEVLQAAKNQYHLTYEMLLLSEDR